MKVTVCQMCKGSMIECPDKEDLPEWAEQLKSDDSPYAVVGWKLQYDRDTDLWICPFCFDGVSKASERNVRMDREAKKRKKAGANVEVEKVQYCPPDFGLDFGVIDALTPLEEMLLCPIHCCVTVYCVWGTGALKYKGMCYGVEQDVARFFDTVPVEPARCPVLKVARGKLSYRAPFLVDHLRMRMAWRKYFRAVLAGVCFALATSPQ